MKPAIFILLLVLVACSPQAIATISPTDYSTPTTVPGSGTCLRYSFITNVPYNCVREDEFIRIDTQQDEIGFQGYSGFLTVRGVIEIEEREDLLILRVIEGSAVVGTNGRTRVATRGLQIEVHFLDGIMQVPSDPRPIGDYDPSPEAEITSEFLELMPTIMATFEGDCTPRADWGNTYTVKSGDVLAEIAEAHDITITAITEANCLDNPNRLYINQVLRLPGDIPTATPSPIAFRADVFGLNQGDCTTLRWDVFNVAAVYIDDEETTANNFLQVCPETTTTYTLRVVYHDETEISREIIITVNPD